MEFRQLSNQLTGPTCRNSLQAGRVDVAAHLGHLQNDCLGLASLAEDVPAPLTSSNSRSALPTSRHHPCRLGTPLNRPPRREVGSGIPLSSPRPLYRICLLISTAIIAPRNILAVFYSTAPEVQAA
jgi:hypothetical protein